MFVPSRRHLLHSLICLPALAGARPLLMEKDTSLASTDYLNVHLRGPFTYAFFSNKVLLISPDCLNHHLPSMSSQNTEAPLHQSDYILAGVNPTSAAQPTWTDLSVKRLMIEAKVLNMDTGGVIDKGKVQRFFSIWLPMPDLIAPWHPIPIKVTGSHSPYDPTIAVLLPVGYTFVYKNTTFSGVEIQCPDNPKYNWPAKLVPCPGQNSADIVIEMSSSLDIDCKHKGATEAFADECGLLTGVNPGAKLDLGLDYGPPDVNCGSLEKSLKKRQRRGPIPDIVSTSTAHTGTDCKAALLEIVNVSPNVKLGT